MNVSTSGAGKAIAGIGGKMELVAINHWNTAIATHAANHPTARYLVEDVSIVDPEAVVKEGRLDLLMASPECRFHSRAHGGKPIHDQGRMNPWAVHNWLTTLDVKCVLVENVPEFVDWGPLTPDGRPDKAHKGEHFQAWFLTFHALGYHAEWRMLNAADYGTTLVAADSLNRNSTGRELEPEFIKFAHQRTRGTIHEGDALSLLENHEIFPSNHFDYVFTSPPLMNALHKSRGGNKDTRHKKRSGRGEPLVYGGRENDLGNIEEQEEYIFQQVNRVLKPNRYCTVILQNLNSNGSMIPIAWELGLALSNASNWDMKGDRIWCQENKNWEYMVTRAPMPPTTVTIIG